MKKIIGLLMLMVFAITLTMPVLAQQTVQEKITVNTSDLTVDQLAKIKAQAEVENLQKKLQTYGNWVGVGGEIGTAVKEGLNAVVDVSEKFGKTDVGRFTMVMVAWKIIGKDLVRIALGLLFAFIATIFIFRSYRVTFMERRVKLKDNGFRFWLPNEYQLIEPRTYDGYEIWKLVHVALLLGSFGITYVIMFAQ